MDRWLCTSVQDVLRKKTARTVHESAAIRLSIEALKWIGGAPAPVPARAPKTAHDARKERIRTTTGTARDLLWQRKRAVGTTARLTLLALAAFRGLPYRSVERRTREDISPRRKHLLVVGVWRTLLHALPREHRSQWPRARIEDWMNTVPREV